LHMEQPRFDQEQDETRSEGWERKVRKGDVLLVGAVLAVLRPRREATRAWRPVKAAKAGPPVLPRQGTLIWKPRLCRRPGCTQRGAPPVHGPIQVCWPSGEREAEGEEGEVAEARRGPAGAVRRDIWREGE
jgi:hypothetical protein